MVSLLQTLVGSIIVTLELWLVTSMEMEKWNSSQEISKYIMKMLQLLLPVALITGEVNMFIVTLIITI